MAELREVIVERFFLGIERFFRSNWTKPLRILGPRYSNERLLPQMLTHAAAFFFFCNPFLWWKLKLVPKTKERSSRMARQGLTMTLSKASQTLMSSAWRLWSTRERQTFLCITEFKTYGQKVGWLNLNLVIFVLRHNNLPHVRKVKYDSWRTLILKQRSTK